MVGMRDVAKKAGVSLSTVSLVVNGTGYVSDEMRGRVEAAMRELNYVPNELARSLYSGRTYLIGVIVPTIRHPFFSTMIAAIQRALDDHGLRIMLCSTVDMKAGEAEYVDMLRRRMMDGIVMGAHTTHAPDYWTSIGRPVVAFDRYLGDGIPSVASDHEQGGRMLADLLLRAGARKVATVGGPRAQFHDFVDWAKSRRAAARAHTVGADTTFPTVRYHLTLEKELKAAGARHEYIEAGEVYDFRGYAETMRRVCERAAAGEIDAVVSSDVGAAFCLQEAARLGIRVPEDLQIVAYDGTYLADAAGRKVTAVRQDFSAIAELLATRMVESIRVDMDRSAARSLRSKTPGAVWGVDEGDGEPGELDAVAAAMELIDDLVPVSLVPGETTRCN
ncbi:MAG TPA: LacI family DNA-binding transcriptional regulator [Bifidobacterium pullorum]|nr:LacI family DNA-binding transcriptional regulator [Bifidobacterium pullorum]